MKKGGSSESTIIVGPSKSVLVYALHSLEYVLGLAVFRVFVPKLLLLYDLDFNTAPVEYFSYYKFNALDSVALFPIAQPFTE